MKFAKFIGILMIYILIGSDIIALRTEIRRGRHTNRLKNRYYRSNTETNKFETIFFLLSVFEGADIYSDVIKAIKLGVNLAQVDILGQHLQCTIPGLSEYYNAQLRVPFPTSHQSPVSSIPFESKTYCKKFFEEALVQQKDLAREKIRKYQDFKDEIDRIPEADLVNNPQNINQFPMFKVNFEHTKKIYEKKNKSFTIQDAIINFMDTTDKKLNFYKGEFTQAVLELEEYDNFNNDHSEGHKYCDSYGNTSLQEKDKVSFKQKLLAIWKTSVLLYKCSGPLGIILDSAMTKLAEIAVEKAIEIIVDIFGAGILTFLKIAWQVIKVIWYLSKAIYYQVKGIEHSKEYYENYGMALGNGIRLIMVILKIGKRRKMIKK